MSFFFLFYVSSRPLPRAALFLRLGLSSTPIRHENGAFRKHSSNRRNLKTPGLRQSVDRKQFENAALRRLGLPSTLIRHGNGAFRKQLFKPEEFENAGLAYKSVDRKQLENG